MRPDSRSIPVLILAAAVVAGTVAVVLLPEPEAKTAVSADGRMRVDARGAGELVVTRVSDEGSVYRVTSDGQPIGTAFDLAFSYASDFTSMRTDGPLALWGYDASRLAWRRTASVDDPVVGIITADGIPGLSDWMPAPADPGAPHKNVLLLLDALLSAPPPGAVGYAAFSAVGPDEMTLFIVDDPLDRGGCGGRFQLGSSQSFTSREVVAGNTTRVAVLWEIAEGCPEGIDVMSTGEVAGS